MKNISKRFVFIAMAAVIGLSFAVPVHSGGIVDSVFSGGAKNLAKQTMDLNKKAADIEKQKAELQVKAADIEKKAANLSGRDRRMFREELARLNVEGPQWLFSGAPGLLSGAEDIAADDDIGGILGGLAGLIRSLGGNRGVSSGGSSSSGNSDGSAASSGGDNTTAPSSGNTTAFPGGGKTAAFFNMFDGKNYHMKTKTIIEGAELPPEAAA